jgi:hypothetical protein
MYRRNLLPPSSRSSDQQKYSHVSKEHRTRLESTQTPDAFSSCLIIPVTNLYGGLYVQYWCDCSPFRPQEYTYLRTRNVRINDYAYPVELTASKQSCAVTIGNSNPSMHNLYCHVYVCDYRRVWIGDSICWLLIHSRLVTTLYRSMIHTD